MSGSEIPIYRLPLSPGQRVGSIRVVKDRNHRVYIDGHKIASSVQSGDFLVLTLDDGRIFNVLAADLVKVRPRGK
jgi:hypothetical protein